MKPEPGHPVKVPLGWLGKEERVAWNKLKTR